MASHKTEHEPSMTRLSHATWGSSLLQRLHSMQQVNEQCDVLFMNTVESSVSIGAHSVVLNAASPKLRSELRECGPRLLVDGASVAAIMTMVDFIYLGSVEVADSELPAVQALAEHFEIMGLVEACCKASVERYDEAIQAGDADGEETTSTIKEEEVDDDDDDDDGSPDGMIIDVNADGQRDKGTMGSGEIAGLQESRAARPVRGTAVKATATAKRLQKAKLAALSEAAVAATQILKDTCQECGQKFCHPEFLAQHMQFHEDGAKVHKSPKLTQNGDKPHCCEHCNESFCYRNQCEEHQLVHAQEKPSTHSFSGQKVTSGESKITDKMQQYQHQQQPVALHRCEVCSCKFRDKESYTRHMQHCHSGTYEFTCDCCSKGFMQRECFEAHVKGHQSIATSFKCTICNHTLMTKKSLARHIRVLHKCGKLHQCQECGAAFVHRSSLAAHGMTHSDTRPYSCEICNKAFRSTSQLKEHKQVHSEEKPHECSFCGQRFRNRRSKRVHELQHQSLALYKCEVCSKEFYRRELYTKHLHRHKGTFPFYCDFCGKGFMVTECFKTHVNHHKGIPSSFKCSLCGVEVTTKGGLSKHMKTMHGSEQQYQCTECGLTFVHNSSFNAHKKTHTGEKPYPCLLCGKSFRSNSHLKAHVRIHTGEKPFSCSFCDEKFAQNSNKTRHEEKHHHKQRLQGGNTGFISKAPRRDLQTVNGGLEGDVAGH